MMLICHLPRMDKSKDHIDDTIGITARQRISVSSLCNPAKHESPQDDPTQSGCI